MVFSCSSRPTILSPLSLSPASSSSVLTALLFFAPAVLNAPSRAYPNCSLSISALLFDLILGYSKSFKEIFNSFSFHDAFLSQYAFIRGCFSSVYMITLCTKPIFCITKDSYIAALSIVICSLKNTPCLSVFIS